ncbi:hypothetical protein K7432_012598 [Basidiobolus ranarum]|uniref:Fungal lipase-type domain-containing protein n=1 Tax=Basidiobolus ranarum TaxID=34480 RepID=A0ABR2VS16_9FUNG
MGASSTLTVLLVILGHIHSISSQEGGSASQTEESFEYATVIEPSFEHSTMPSNKILSTRLTIPQEVPLAKPRLRASPARPRAKVSPVGLRGKALPSIQGPRKPEASPSTKSVTKEGPFRTIILEGKPTVVTDEQLLEAEEASKRAEARKNGKNGNVLTYDFDESNGKQSDALIKYAEAVAQEREKRLEMGQQMVNGTWINKPYETTLVDPRIQKWLRLHANYAAAAYCFKVTVKNWSCGDKCVGNMNVFEYFSSFLSGVAGYVGVDRDLKKIVVAFRGSLNIRNWIYNVDAIRLYLNYPGGTPAVRVHGGFLKAYQGLKAQVRSGMTKVLEKLIEDKEDVSDYEIIVTGHSLGAAVAIHGALDIRQFFLLKYRLDPEKFLVHTYATPRAGNEAFSQLVLQTFSDGEPSLNLLRVTNNADPVPHVPPMIFGYIHYPHEIWVHNISSTEAQTVDCKDKLPTGFREDPHCNGGKVALNIAEHTRAWDLQFGSGVC